MSNKEIWSPVRPYWLEVVSENDMAYGVVDRDGVSTVVFKGPMMQVRYKGESK